MFDTIVLAVDGSENAERATEVTRDLAGQLGSQVIVLYAFDPVPRYLGDEQTQAIVARGTAHGTEVAEKAAEFLRAADVEFEIDVLEGPAAEAILRVAEVRQANLIVMGSRGLGGLGAMLLGSVSRKVLQNASCPVLIVH